MTKLAIIGSGISGISLASNLKSKLNIQIFEKSRGAGGRMSTRKTDLFEFDHGTQFFKIKTKEFRDFLSPLFLKNIIKHWQCKLIEIQNKKIINEKQITIDDEFFVGVPFMDSIVKSLSKNYNLKLNTEICNIEKINKHWRLYDKNNKCYEKFDWVVFTIPSEQTCSLIPKNVSFYDIINQIKMKSCYSLMIGKSKPLNLKFDIASIHDEDIAWIAVNNSKPERNKKYSLLVNSSYDFAKKNSNQANDKVLDHMLSLTSKILNKDLSDSILTTLHQWRFVEAYKHPSEDYFIDPNLRIAVCGDWCVDSRVEGAFTSAYKLSQVLLEKM